MRKAQTSARRPAPAPSPARPGRRRRRSLTLASTSSAAILATSVPRAGSPQPSRHVTARHSRAGPPRRPISTRVPSHPPGARCCAVRRRVRLPLGPRANQGCPTPPPLRPRRPRPPLAASGGLKGYWPGTGGGECWVLCGEEQRVGGGGGDNNAARCSGPGLGGPPGARPDAPRRRGRGRVLQAAAASACSRAPGRVAPYSPGGPGARHIRVLARPRASGRGVPQLAPGRGMRTSSPASRGSLCPAPAGDPLPVPPPHPQ